MDTGRGKIYPNLFTMLVGLPGTGKSKILEVVERCWHSLGDVHVAPRSMTKAGMIDFMKAGVTTFKHSALEMEIYHSLQICAAEFSVLCPSYDQAFLSHCSQFWDAEDRFSEITRQGGQIDIDYPILGIIAGVQPSLMGDIFPESAWHQGFFARTNLVYAAEARDTQFFKPDDETGLDDDLYASLVADLKKMRTRWGEIKWTPKALGAFKEWERAKFAPQPVHPRLSNYNTRRGMHAVKLAMLFAIGNYRDAVMEEDIWATKALMETSEEDLPDMFRAMSITPHAQLVNETYQFVVHEHLRTKSAIGKPRIVGFLMGRTAQHMVDVTINNMVAAGILKMTLNEQAAGMDFSYLPGEMP